MKFSKTQVALLVALLLSNAIILYVNLEWNWLRMLAALALTFVLPGWAWLPLFDWLKTDRAIERLVLVPGLSSLLAALVLLAAVLWPGSFSEMPALLALNLATLGGLVAQSFIKAPSPVSLVWPSKKVLLILLAILAVATYTRVVRLGYAEFHEDELENMRLIVRAYKGEEYAPFLDSKGPIHWLLPAGLWYLNGWVNEGVARTPFVVTSLLTIPAMYAVARRMTGRSHIGLLAAAFVGLNGFYVAYARHVENQSLIVFWGALAMWLAYRHYRENLPSFLPWIALALAIGLVAHPDVLLYLPVFAYVLGLQWWRARSIAWPWLAAAGLIFIGLNAVFYIPYLFDPNIGAVQQYFAEDRIGEALLYNRVENLFDQDKLYTTRWHAPVLVLLFAWLLIRNFAQWRWTGWAILAALSLGMVSAVAQPELWIINQTNVAFIPFALLTLLVLLLPQTSFEIKTGLLWMMAPLGALLFLAKDAADHIQIAYTAWALLSAIALADLWACLGHSAAEPARSLMPDYRAFNLPSFAYLTRYGRLIKSIIALALALVMGLILFYQNLAFAETVTTYWQAKIDSATNPNSTYNLLYGSIPRPRKIFSNPRLGGWKVPGYLWHSGALTGDFRSINESFAVPIWYTLQTPRSCYDDPQHYWVRRDWQGWPDEEKQVLEAGYTLTRVVLVDQEPKLHLYEKGAPAREPEILDMEDYRRKFDLMATPANFARGESIGQPASLNFGDKLLLRGFDLPAQASAGNMLPVTVYWESLAPMPVRYRAFAHLVAADGAMVSQHDDDPACRLITSEMRPGQESSRQFRLPLDPALAPGEYSVILGIYHPETLARLDIWDNLAGRSPGNSVVLGRVRVEKN